MIKVLGLLNHTNATEWRRPTEPFDLDFIKRHAVLYEDWGYDRVLIGQHARSPDSLSIAAYVAACTKSLKFMIAHRPGFIAPTMAARMFATIDRLSSGRGAAHIITAASDIETQCDGDFLSKDERYRRSGEYVDILRSMWSSEAPVDHEGPFYSFKQGFCEARPIGGALPIFWGGASERAIQFGAECADVYAMGGANLERAASLVNSVRSAAMTLGRAPTYCMSLRIILGATEDQAWRKAAQIKEAIIAFQSAGGVVGRDKGDADLQVMMEAEQASAGSDPHFWTGLTSAVNGRTHVSALVGAPDQLAGALKKYHALGISHFILTGFDPIPDTIEIGRELIPRLHQQVAVDVRQ